MPRRWKGLLELQLRKVHGISFQDFVGSFMGAIYGDDFVRVRAQGSWATGATTGSG